ncbi:MAG: hypothetical protein QOJ70_1133 [Acidobacteriota bacterium]|jgi:hypothetical protein|nr:hypothetical protein [Acidobacteriota bacterium]
MKTLIEDDELKRLRAMADGSKPFESAGLWERIAALEWAELKTLDARTRLGLGYYVAAKRRVEQMQEVA